MRPTDLIPLLTVLGLFLVGDSPARPPASQTRVGATNAAAMSARPPVPAAYRRADLLARHAPRRLQFEANRGQADPPVSFVARGRGYHVALTPTETIVALRPSGGETGRRGKSPAAGAAVLRMRLVGASPHSRAAGVEALPGRSNYLRGSDPRAWRTDIPTYAKVEQRDVYPGVSLVLYGNGRDLDRTLNGSVDTYVVKLSAGGTALVYATYLGGSGAQKPYGIAVDAAGSAYVMGYTNSPNFPTTPGAFQRTLGGGSPELPQRHASTRLSTAPRMSSISSI